MPMARSATGKQTSENGLNLRRSNSIWPSITSLMPKNSGFVAFVEGNLIQRFSKPGLGWRLASFFPKAAPTKIVGFVLAGEKNLRVASRHFAS
jgi:hypothetical protein